MSDIRITPQPSHRNASGTIHTIVGSTTTCLIHFWSDNHSTADCRSYSNLPVETKKDVLRVRNACTGCLATGHTILDCTNRVECTADENCREFHHPSLHTPGEVASAEGVVATISGHHPNPDAGRVLLPIMKVVPKSGPSGPSDMTKLGPRRQNSQLPI